MEIKPDDPRSPRHSALRSGSVEQQAETLVTTPESALTRRRSLLKAAASVAPVLATLPNGAALANASAFQCANEQLTTEPPNELMGTVTQPSAAAPGVGGDNFYRVAGKTWTDNTAGLLYNFRAFNGDNVTVDIDGKRFPISPPQNAADVQLLVLYTPTLDSGSNITDVAADPTNAAPTACTVGTNMEGWSMAPSSPDYCIYPIAQFGPKDTPINIGMTASCLTSFVSAPPP